MPRTHSIGALLDLLREGLADELVVPEQLQQAASLTDYAVLTRYPGEHEPVDEDEYEEAVAIAESVVAWAEGVIG